jgi:chemotaxis protein MotA
MNDLESVVPHNFRQNSDSFLLRDFNPIKETNRIEKGWIIGVATISLLFATMVFVGGSVNQLVHIPSLCFIVIGTCASVLLQCGLNPFEKALRLAATAFFDRPDEVSNRIDWLVEVATTVRKEGRLIAEQLRTEVDDTTLRAGLEGIADGISEETLRRNLSRFYENRLTILQEGTTVFETFALYAPAFGLIGTVLGLINLLGSLGDLEKMGPQMALALLTTLYGAILGNVVCLPIAGRLRTLREKEIKLAELSTEGLISILNEESVVILTQRLKPFGEVQTHAR